MSFEGHPAGMSTRVPREPWKATWHLEEDRKEAHLHVLHGPVPHHRGLLRPRHPGSTVAGDWSPRIVIPENKKKERCTVRWCQLEKINWLQSWKQLQRSLKQQKTCHKTYWETSFPWQSSPLLLYQFPALFHIFWLLLLVYSSNIYVGYTDLAMTFNDKWFSTHWNTKATNWSSSSKNILRVMSIWVY